MIIHGFAIRPYSPEYRLWCEMRARCYNPKRANFWRYGGRGVTVCEEWKNSFLTFLNHIGKRPSRLHSIDRIDGTLGYQPGNVRWATAKEQARNRRNNIFVTIDGVTQCLADWAMAYGISPQSVRGRLRIGWTLEDALNKPVQRRRK